MSRRTKLLLLVGALAIGVIGSSALLAQDTHDRSMMDRGGMMGGGGMMGSMMHKMEQCNQMMQGMMGGARRPDEQPRTPPSVPDKQD